MLDFAVVQVDADSRAAKRVSVSKTPEPSRSSAMSYNQVPVSVRRNRHRRRDQQRGVLVGDGDGRSDVRREVREAINGRHDRRDLRDRLAADQITSIRRP